MAAPDNRAGRIWWSGIKGMYLGIDIGTSGVKAVLIDGSGAVVDQASAALDVSRPQPLWSEQDPADWWAATKAAVGGLQPHLRKAVRSIGLAGQMHGATLLGKEDRPLRPAILWNDGRSAAQCAALDAALPDLGTITGNRAMPGFTAPKLVWVREQEPDVYAATAKVLLPKDYVRLLMTGEYASDMSDSAGTLWLDVGARDWSYSILAATGLSRGQMTTLFEGNAVTGQLRAEMAVEWGMDRVPVVAGAGDNAAGAIGVGVVSAGEAFLSLGTSGVLFLAGAAYTPNPASGVHTFCHALPNRWHQMSAILSAASCVDWVARLTGQPSAAQLFCELETADRGPASELFLPYLSGERTPHNDPHAKGVFFGMTHESDGLALSQAVLEGVAYAFRDGLDALTDSGAEVDSITVIGGGARSAYWGRVLSAVLNRPLVYRDGGEVGPAFGAARLAQLADTDGAIEQVCAAPPIKAVIEPDARLAEHYAAQIDTYRALYANLKSQFQESE